MGRTWTDHDDAPAPPASDGHGRAARPVEAGAVEQGDGGSTRHLVSPPARACAFRALVQERVPEADLSTAERALEAAVDLARWPRREWAPANGPWEHLVTALAVAVLRTEGGLSCSRAQALAAVRAALDDLRAGGRTS